MRPLQDQERIVVVGGRAPSAPDALHTDPQGAGVHKPLPAPGAGKLHHLIVRVRQVQADTHGRIQHHGLLPAVLEPDTPRQGGNILEHGVEQGRPHARQPVHQAELQGLCLPFILTIGGGQAVQGRLSGRHLMPLIDKIADPAPVLLQDRHRRLSEVAAPRRGKFPLHLLQREHGIILTHRRRKDARRLLQQMVKGRPVPHPLPEVQLPRLPVGEDLHDITVPAVLKMKRAAFFLKINAHGSVAFLSFPRNHRDGSHGFFFPGLERRFSNTRSRAVAEGPENRPSGTLWLPFRCGGTGEPSLWNPLEPEKNR